MEKLKTTGLSLEEVYKITGEHADAQFRHRTWADDRRCVSRVGANGEDYFHYLDFDGSVGRKVQFAVDLIKPVWTWLNPPEPFKHEVGNVYRLEGKKYHLTYGGLIDVSGARWQCHELPYNKNHKITEDEWKTITGGYPFTYLGRCTGFKIGEDNE